MNKYLLFFQKINKIGLKTIISMIDFFGSINDAFSASYFDFKKFGLSENIIQEILDKRKNFNFNEEIEKYKKFSINIISYFDSDYPNILKNIPNPPLMIFYKGNINSISKNIAVVGSRDCSDYGVSVARDFCNYFVNQNIVIVSGGAIGIDSVSHEVCIKKNFPTISVMGAGLDIVYPYKNKYLFEKIIENNGLIVSEFPIGINAFPQNFVMRNRIIAGLSSGVLIVEAGIKSGTMTTAEFAINQNKNVFVVPGSIYSNFSAGTNYLIKNGAIFVTDPKDIEEMIWGVSQNERQKVKNEIENKNEIDISWMNDDEKNIFNLISYKLKNIENIILESNVDIKKINSILTLFEIKGFIVNIGGMNYIRVK